jgi:hypothetical protein
MLAPTVAFVNANRLVAPSRAQADRERVAPCNFNVTTGLLPARHIGGGRRDITMIRLRYERITRSMRRPLVRVQAH